VTAGDSHSCGLKTDGRVFCWGGNAQGQLGDGTLTTQFAPVEVTTNARFASIYTLFAASCGLTSAGDLFCWGGNANGWLGIPGTSRVLTPTVVPAPEPFSQVATGGGHICAIGVSGTTYCWGAGSATGRLGANGATPVTAPTQVQTPVPFTAVVAGDQYSCGLGNDKRAYCWGVDFMGQLGDSIPDRSFVEGRATVAPVAGGHDFTALFAGPLADNTCALAVDGSSWCWGGYVESNAASTTADCLNPSSRCSPVPVRVSSTVRFTSMTTGSRSQCGLDSTGQAFCWGNGFDARGSNFQPVPAKLETGLRFTSISAGRSHRCGVTLSNAIFCWGDNGSGKIGDYSAVPTPSSSYGVSIVVSPALIAAP
jgi:alpha-tubulin suppressor-like RCC1 family protein